MKWYGHHVGFVLAVGKIHPMLELFETVSILGVIHTPLFTMMWIWACQYIAQVHSQVYPSPYRHTALMTKPCMNCNVGAHPTQMCIKSKNSTIGAPPTPQPQQMPPNTPVYTKWSDGRDANKRVEDTENFSQYSLFPQAKNEQRPSLFPPF